MKAIILSNVAQISMKKLVKQNRRKKRIARLTARQIEDLVEDPSLFFLHFSSVYDIFVILHEKGIINERQMLEGQIVSAAGGPTRKRRKRRQDPGLWDDPSQPSNAEANISSKKIGARISPGHLDLFNRVAEQHPDKRAALERAVELLAAEVGLELDEPT